MRTGNNYDGGLFSPEYQENHRLYEKLFDSYIEGLDFIGIINEELHRTDNSKRKEELLEAREDCCASMEEYVKRMYHLLNQSLRIAGH